MVYAYRCETCNLKIEAKRPVHERDKPLPCPQCAQPCKRIFTPTQNLFIPPFTYPYTRTELADAIAPTTQEEIETWKRYG